MFRVCDKLRTAGGICVTARIVCHQVEPAGEHEFVRRYVACLLAVSSAAAAPLQQLQQLAQQQHQLQHGQPAGGARWFSNNVLIYHLVVTDGGVTPDAR